MVTFTVKIPPADALVHITDSPDPRGVDTEMVIHVTGDANALSYGTSLSNARAGVAQRIGRGAFQRRRMTFPVISRAAPVQSQPITSATSDASATCT